MFIERSNGWGTSPHKVGIRAKTIYKQFFGLLTSGEVF